MWTYDGFLVFNTSWHRTSHIILQICLLLLADILFHCKKQSVHATLIGVIYDTVGVLITLIVGWLTLHSVKYYTTFFTVFILILLLPELFLITYVPFFDMYYICTLNVIWFMLNTCKYKKINVLCSKQFPWDSAY